MRLRQLVYFERVMRLGSIRRAAAEIEISSPALSDQIRRLEEELNVVLFIRGRSGAEPTDAAHAILPHVEALLAAESDLHFTVSQFKGLERGTLRLGVVSGATGPRFMDTLQHFHRAYPSVRLSVVEAGSNDICDQVNQGALDLGVVVTIDGGTVEGLRLMPVIRSQLSVVVAASGPLADRDSLTADELAGQSLVIHQSGYALGAVIARLREQIRFEDTFQADGQNSVQQMVGAGLGVAFSSGMDYSGLMLEHNLRLIPLSDPHVPTALNLAVRADRQPLPVTREFMRLFREHFDPASQ